MIRASLIAALSITTAIAPSAARGAEAPGWRVERGRAQCTLAPTKGPKFSLQLDDSAGLATLFVSRLSSNEFEKASVEIRLFPGDTSSGPDTSATWMPGGLAVFGLSQDFLDQFAASTRMIISVGGKKRFDIPLQTDAGAVWTLRSCHNTLLRSWGVDPTQFTTLRKRPEPINETDWLTNKEVDAVATEAMARRGGGPTVITFLVQPDGHVRDCRIAVSSGLPTFDRLACASVLKNARYEPAIDRQGKPVAMRLAYLQLWAFGRP